MKKSTSVSELPEFDIVEHLPDEEAMAQYLSLVAQEDDPALLVAALGDVARARGMAEIARSAGITREALYKATRPGSQPRFDTVFKVFRALGVDLVPTLATRPKANARRPVPA